MFIATRARKYSKLLSEVSSSQTLSFNRSFNEPIEALDSCFFLLCAHYPPVHCLPIIRRLGLKEFPRCLVSFEFRRIRLDKFGTSLFIRIDSRSIFFSRCKGFQTRRLHSVLFDELQRNPDIYSAPDTGRFTRRKPNHVTLVIDLLAHAVNPTKAKRFLDRFGPGNARPACFFLVEPNPEFV